MDPDRTSRRDFLRATLHAGAALSVVGASGHPEPAAAEVPESGSWASHPLRILILGGTAFLGPHQIAYALGRGHEVTTFTRGRTEPDVHRALFRDVEQLIGDRAGDLDVLRGRRWDAVIDNSGREVEWTTATAELLRDSVEHYLYTSSTGVYYPYLGSDIDETTPLVMEMPAGLTEADSGEHAYGIMKARSEAEVRRVFGDGRSIIVRPGYMMGPGDRTDRFTYWPVRLHRGGAVLVPGDVDDPVQYIDVRDVAEWNIRLIEQALGGVFNATGPASPTGMLRFVHGAHAAFASEADFVSVPDLAFLEEHRVRFAVPWIPPVGNNYGSARANISRAKSNGLTFRPLARSVRDIHEWWISGVVPAERVMRMERGERSLIAREAAILEAWRRDGASRG